MDQPWERQPKEPGNWYDRFTRYRLLGPTRTLTTACRSEQAALGKRQSKGPSSGWAAAFVKWNWQERAEAFDEHLRQIDEAKWLERRELQRESEWEARNKILEVAKNMLEFTLVEIVTDHEGAKTAILPARWTMADAGRFLLIASKLGRLATELPLNFRGELIEADALSAPKGAEFKIITASEKEQDVLPAD